MDQAGTVDLVYLAGLGASPGSIPFDLSSRSWR